MEGDQNETENEPKPSTSRRTWTMRNNAARQVAVNFLPSRQLPCNTIRFRRNNSEHSALLEEAGEVEDSDSTEQQANIIVREMEQHQQLMEDNLQAEELRREALRELPQGLTMKRNVRAKLSASVSLRSKRRPISMFKRLRYRISFGFKKIQDRANNLIFSIELWYEAIRKVEGHFGSAVASYFYFLRWLFLVNLAMTVVVVSFVVVPQALHDSYTGRTSGSDKSGGFLDFISGKGIFEDTLLFYGHYHSDASNSTGPINYNITFGYFYTMLSLYMVVFAILCYRTAYSYRRNFISAAGGLRHVYAGKVLCGWDYGIATVQAAALNHRSVYNEFKELLTEQTKKNEQISFCTSLGHYMTNFLVGIVVLAFIVGLEVGFWFILSVRVEAMESLRATEYWAVLLTLIVTLVVSVCPLLFTVVGKLEFYGPRTSLYVTLCRTFLLDISTLFLLLVFWSGSKVDCWETALGQESYRLVLFDALFSLVLLPVIEFTRGFVYKVYPSTTEPEFNIAYNSLTLIYNQAALWLGMIFSPLLVIMVTFKFVLLFYVKRECALRACQPARKVWRAAQTQTILYMLVNLSLFITLFALGSLFFRTSSHKCGPFKEYPFVYSVLSEGLLQLSAQPTLHAVLVFVTRPGVIGFVLLFLCVLVYYMRAKSHAQQSMVGILRHMLVLEAKDKDFLLAAIAKVSNGEWLYCPKDDGNCQPIDSHTWKYLNDDNIRKPSNAGFHFDVSKLNHSLMDSSRPRSYMSAKDNRPSSIFKDSRPKSHRSEDGDTDSSFSWQGSGGLHEVEEDNCEVQIEEGGKKWL